jgi:hypothetical protein
MMRWDTEEDGVEMEEMEKGEENMERGESERKRKELTSFFKWVSSLTFSSGSLILDICLLRSSISLFL